MGYPCGYTPIMKQINLNRGDIYKHRRNDNENENEKQARF